MFESLAERLNYRAEAQGDQRAYTFLNNGEDEGDTLTYAQLDRQAWTIAIALRETLQAGDRALLMYPPGLEFVAAFFGCLYARVIAVPAYPPHPSRPARCWPRLRSIAREAGTSAVLCPQSVSERLAELIQASPEFAGCSLLATDQLPAVDNSPMRSPRVDPDEIAFLQFTSGSTAAPKGVMISHGNIMHNLSYLAASTDGDSTTVQVSWLPTYHDMGLFAGLLYPLYLGCPSYLMSPIAFLQKPLRWLSAMSRFGGTNSGGPNFAYELCADRIAPEQCQGLDLSRWKIAFSGAEPIRRSSLGRFWRAFAPCGFRWQSFRSAYGLAEATVFVSGGAVGDPPHADNGLASTQPIACGTPGEDTRIKIVEPETRRELAGGDVGEIWLQSPSVARGYWNRPDETARTFSATLATGEPTRYLRTGDLGFLSAGELFVTGRIKDLIIIRGRKVYPHDIEQAVESNHDLILPNATAAVSVPTDQGERLVIVAEVNQRRVRGGAASQETSSDSGDKLENLIGSVRQMIAEQFELQTFGVTLISRGSIPKTSSGKIQRHACRDAVLTGSLDTVHAWTMQPWPSLRPALSLSQPPVCR